ncbi:hypothetical protein PACTADRAFT_79915 [Pachysolen tannophilus NRRL Y-2460]|uniref:UDENN domain-containing protein n=2 Tax=Pachysolen tannophilus NRRL Y-2460 TaxID=669874 RepID=A0A1E4TVM0_PACTA|nr:hypothetical protein PACTADRAFT_79915 [Pachysolen tannophilus NRRL Y-2460]
MEFILSLMIIYHGGKEKGEQESQNLNSSSYLLSYNCFPYFDISKLDLLLKLDHYILGTTNPIFKEIGNSSGPVDDNAKLWDLLFDLDTNQLWVNNTSTPIDRDLLTRSTNNPHNNKTFDILSSSFKSKLKINGIINRIDSTVSKYSSNGNSTSSNQQQNSSSVSFKKVKRRNSKISILSINSLNSNGQEGSLNYSNFDNDYDDISFNDNMTIRTEKLKDLDNNNNNNNHINNTMSNGHSRGPSDYGFKYDFTKSFKIKNQDDDENKQFDRFDLIFKKDLEELTNGNHDDLKIFLHLKKKIIFLYFEILLNFKNFEDLDKVISYKTFIYSKLFIGLNHQNKTNEDINLLLNKLNEEILKFIEKYKLVLPYGYTIFENFDSYKDKDLQIQYNRELEINFFQKLKKYRNFHSLYGFTCLKNEDFLIPDSELLLKGPGNINYYYNFQFFIDQLFKILQNFSKEFINTNFLLLLLRNLNTFLKDNNQINQLVLIMPYIEKTINYGNNREAKNSFEILLELSIFFKNSRKNDDLNHLIKKEFDLIFAKFRGNFYGDLLLEFMD